MAQLNDLIVTGAARFLNTVNGKITNAATADNASSVGGFTVGKSVPSNAVFTDASVTAVGNHYTPATNNASSISKSASGGSAGTWGSTNMVTSVTIKRDAKGHVTDMEVGSVALPSNPNTDTKVTAVGNHYTPSTNNASSISKSASGGSAGTWGTTNMVTGVTLKRDAAGHVTDMELSSVALPSNPNTDTKVTAVDNHYTPSTNNASSLSASATGATAAWSIDVVKGVTIQRDAKGHVTGLSVTSGKIPGNPNTDRYVNTAAFADDTSANANSPVKMTLTRAGSDSATVIANIPKVSSSSAGVAPKGAAVSSQSQSTKFLREDGSWAAPSYTTNTDTKVTAVGNHYTPATNNASSLSVSATGATAAWSIDVVKGVTIKRDAAGHVTGLEVTSGKIPAKPTYTASDVGALASTTKYAASGSVGGSASSALAAADGCDFDFGEL